MKRWKRYALIITAAVMAILGSATATFAGEWQYFPNGSWAYAENGVYLTGWQQINGVWYYLDPATFLWVEHPAINVDSVCYLLENAVNETGWYNKEKERFILHYQVESSNNTSITVTVRMESRPGELATTLNTFVVDRRTRIAQSTQTKENLYLE